MHGAAATWPPGSHHDRTHTGLQTMTFRCPGRIFSSAAILAKQGAERLRTGQTRGREFASFVQSVSPQALGRLTRTERSHSADTFSSAHSSERTCSEEVSNGCAFSARTAEIGPIGSNPC